MAVGVEASASPAVDPPGCRSYRGSVDLIYIVGEWFGSSKLTGSIPPCKGILHKQGRVGWYLRQVLERTGEGCRLVAVEAEGGACVSELPVMQHEGEA